MDITIIDAISTLGIPAAIAAFVLVRLEQTIKALRDELAANTKELALLKIALLRERGLHE